MLWPSRPAAAGWARSSRAPSTTSWSDLASRGSGNGRLVDLRIGDVEALVAGLPTAGGARCCGDPGHRACPPTCGPLLTAREPVCLVSRLDGDEVVDTALWTADTIAAAGEPVVQEFGRRVSGAVVAEDRVITVLWPVPQLVIVGAGEVAEALGPAAALLGWQTRTVVDAQTASGLIAGLASIDNLVVASHDAELAGRALAAGLSSEVGYIGALGSRRAQQARADWLAYRGITDLGRIHGPAGLDIGAETPAEIAVSILAEAVAARSGVTAPPGGSPRTPRSPMPVEPVATYTGAGPAPRQPTRRDAVDDSSGR